MNLNKLLQRQVKKHLPESYLQDPAIAALLESVNASYQAFEHDNELAERAFRITEAEYKEVNQQLHTELTTKRKSISKLINLVDHLGGNLKKDSANELLDIAEFLEKQIQQRKAAESSLTATANRLRALIKNMQMGVLVEDEHRMIVLTNQYFCNIFQIPVSPQDLRGTDCSGSAQASKFMFKDPEAFVVRIDELLRDRIIVTNEVLELADGRYFERDYIPIFVEEVYKGHLWNYRDITIRKTAEKALRKKEEKYRNIIANMRLGIMEVSTNNEIQFANQCFCEMSGYTLQEIMGKDPVALFAKPESIPILAQKAELRKSGVADAYEITVRDKFGLDKWWLVSGAPMYNDAGELKGTIGIHLDITRQKQLQAELQEARQLAEQSSAAKEIFLANMSHEIRTPLNAVIGMAKQLQKSTLNEQQHFYLDTLNKASQHLLEIINDILDVSKIEAGKLDLETIGFNLKETLDQVVHVMRPKTDEKQLVMRLHYSPEIPKTLMGDPMRLTQILLNLVSNAIKFTEFGQILLSVKLVEPEDRKRCTIGIEVTDTGIGMSRKFVEQLFDKFVQEDRSTARKYGGTGLGMTICKQLVELMGGTIEVRSKKGRGTTVRVEIPFTVGKDLSPESEERAQLAPLSLSGCRILLAEDNELNRLVANTVLQDYGVVITEAVNGREAVERMKAEEFDLILMDMQMPEMSGIEASLIIRKQLKKDLPIIALTANAVKGIEEQCLDAGMNAYITKPFSEVELINTIKGFCKTRLEEKKLYSLEHFERISRGNTLFIRRILDIFSEQTPQLVTQMESAAVEGNLPQVKALAHKIKPTLDQLEISAARQLVQEIEATTPQQFDPKLMSNKVQLLQHVISRVCAQIQQEPFRPL